MNQKIGKNDKYEEKKCLKEIPCSDPKSKTDFQKKINKTFLFCTPMAFQK